MSQAAVLARVTKLCMELPEASADDRHPPHRGFVVNKKSFAYFTVNEHGDGRVALCVRTVGRENEDLVASNPQRFGLPKYVARHGWVNYFLDLADRPVDWAEVAELVRDSYRIQAPKRLSKLLGDG
jgi:predicted DNA-binding protein (MmcQ/YjbR family)